MGGRPVHFRLLDVGGDKPSPLFDTAGEANPQLGRRGARYLLARPDLLETQARALARASARGPVRIMYPMVVEAGQLAELRRRVERAVDALPRGRLLHGAMFEVPSACLDAPAILEISDFASIGSNDLIQYLFAVDRNNERVAYDYFPDRQVFWRVVEDLVAAARQAGKPLSLCGELAAEPRYVPRLIETGLGSVSVSVRHIPLVRRAAAQALRERKPPWTSQPSPSKANR
jgi:phosphotransferase system enzyme I (PtsI)